MDTAFLDEETTFTKFMKSNQIDANLVYNYRRYHPEHQHPTLLVQQLYEVNKHDKKLICVDAQPKTGRSSGSMLYVLDQFVKNGAGKYLVVMASSRDQCLLKLEFISQLLQGSDNIHTVDINQFFPIKSVKLPKIQLPPENAQTVLVGTPQSFMKFVNQTQIDQQIMWGVLYDECDLVKIYGGLDQVKNVAQWLIQSQKASQRALQVFVGEAGTIEQITSKIPTIIKIEGEEDDAESKQNEKKKQTPGNYFYSVSQDETQKFIVLYITLKLNLIHGKTLVIVPNLYELYKTQLFFNRAGIQHFQIYNHENPQTLKYYVLSTFNTGVINTLVATPKIFEEIQTTFFDRSNSTNSKTHFIFLEKGKKDSFQFKHLDNIVVVDQDPQSVEFQHHLSGFGNVLVVLQNEEEQVESLLSWLNKNSNLDTPLNIKEYPLTHEEIEAFRYRVHDVVANISKHQVKEAQQIDFKKKMLKSPDLVEYFNQNPKEKEILQQQIVKLKAALRRSEIVIEGQIPDYLLPEIIKHQRKSQNEGASQQGRLSKILVHQRDKNYEKVREKRRLLSQDARNMLPKPIEKDPDAIDERLVKKLKMNNEKFIYVDEDKEDPSEIDPTKLKIISNRKLWKLRHGYKLKKSNKRLERKGVFQQ